MALCSGFAGKDAGDPFPKKESKKTPGNPAAAGLPPRNSRLLRRICLAFAPFLQQMVDYIHQLYLPAA